MTRQAATRLSAALGFLAVALGAFGAHALKDILAQNNTTAIWEKAVFYHFIHAAMLYLLAQRKPVPVGPWLSFFIGVMLFSGSLYSYALTKLHLLVIVTPIGGACFLLGWAWLLLGAGKTDH